MEDVTTAPSAPAGVSQAPSAPWPFLKRFIAVFTSPRPLFEHLAGRPSWMAPFLVGVGLVALFYIFLWDPVILPESLEQMEASGQSSEQAAEFMSGAGRWVFTAFGILAVGVITLIWALAVWIVGGFLLGGRFTFRQALSITTHAGLVAVPGVLVKIPMALFSKTAQVSIGPGAFFPPSQAEGFANKFLANVLFNLDLFTIWQTALVALGVSVVALLPRGKAGVGIWGLYAVFVVLGALLGAAFQR